MHQTAYTCEPLISGVFLFTLIIKKRNIFGNQVYHPYQTCTNSCHKVAHADILHIATRTYTNKPNIDHRATQTA